jgi:hypothetical protein
MTKSIKSIANSNFLRFKSYEGSAHIATESSQENLLTILKSLQLKDILDFGAGIGTLSALALDNSKANICAVEKNKWCFDQFTAHLLPSNRITLTSAIPINKHYDLYIIDDSVSVREVCKIFKGGKKTFVVFIEGRRSSTITKFSFFSIFYKYSGLYVVGESRLDLYGNSLREKAGSTFYFSKNSLMAVILSYFKRFKKTGDLRQAIYYTKTTLSNKKVGKF